MSQERFIRCKHCGLPHEADRRTCPVTGKELRRPRSVELQIEQAVAQEDEEGSPKARALHPGGVRAEGGRGDSGAREARGAKAGGPRIDEDESPSVAQFYGQLVDAKYRIEELIGRGGMGMVYRAEHTRLGKHVAIKVLTKGHAPGSPSERRFLREARAAGSIGHPNIVEVFDLGNLGDGTPYIVMELLTGETLSERLKVVGALPVSQVVRIAKEIVGALVAAHRKGIIHRDMKPENVFLVRREGAAGETAKILDFGISKNVGSADTMSLTATGAVVGTPYYLSPEQARGDRRIDHRVDIWSVGVLMYEAVTGVVPFNADNYNALMIKILHDRPTPPTVFRPLVPPEVEAIILKALAHDAAARWQSAEEMLEALRAAEGASPDPYLGQTATELEDMPRGQRAEATVPSLASSAVVEPADEDPTEVSDSFSHADVKLPKHE